MVADASAMRSIRKIVVLGANGAMGSGSGAVFAAAGIPTVVPRAHAREGRGRPRARRAAREGQGLARSRSRAARTHGPRARRRRRRPHVRGGRRGPRDQARGVRAGRRAAPARTRSSPPCPRACRSPRCAPAAATSFRRNFLGIHFFNPPTIIVGCELIPHAEHRSGRRRDRARLPATRRSAARSSRRADTPAFAGNRLGFKVLNEVAQLAEEHGVAFMDQLVGPHTGRALPPLATIDLVGWDVHKAIVDNLYANTHDDGARPVRAARVHAARHRRAVTSAARPATRAASSASTARAPTRDTSCSIRRPATTARSPRSRRRCPRSSSTMKAAIRVGQHAGAMEVLCTRRRQGGELLRQRRCSATSATGSACVGEVVERRATSIGSWASASTGRRRACWSTRSAPRRTIVLLERATAAGPDARSSTRPRTSVRCSTSRRSIPAGSSVAACPTRDRFAW